MVYILTLHNSTFLLYIKTKNYQSINEVLTKIRYFYGLSILFHTTKLRGNCLLNAIDVKEPNDEFSRLLLYQYA